MQNFSVRELFRLDSMSLWERKLRCEGFSRIAGVDEAGRGPLAGPVVAAACIVPQGIFFESLNDSKQLSASQRERLYSQLTSNPLIEFGIGVVDSSMIDEINILQATFLAMKKAVAALLSPPDYLLIDGNQVPSFDIPVQAIVKGDCLSISIAAASILAKVARDRMMEAYDEEWPDYGFKKHKGYGTRLHLEAIEKKGPTPIHRMSFKPLDLLRKAR